MKLSTHTSLLFVFALFLSNTSAQVIEKTVAIAPLYYSTATADKESVDKLYNYTINAMQNTQRIKVLDRIYGKGIISEEKKTTQGIDFVEGNIVDQGKQLGAQYILFIYVNSAQAYELQREVTNNNVKSVERVGYDCDLSIFARVLNVETGQVLASQIITPSGNSSLSDIRYAGKSENKILGNLASSFSTKSQSPREAITKKMEALDPQIRKFIDEVFPIELTISSIREVPKNPKKPDGPKEQEVYIIGGRSTGFKDGDYLIVKEIVVIDIGGKKYIDEPPIGKIRVLRRSENLVTCKVLEGEAVILSKYKEKPNSLKVVYVPVKKLF
jgi:hypothetical protein